VETGPGADADCGAILRAAASPDAAARAEVLSRAQQQGAALGGPSNGSRSLFGRRTPEEKAPAATVGSGQPHAPGAADKAYGQ
jgi:hypothetical protein